MKYNALLESKFPAKVFTPESTDVGSEDDISIFLAGTIEMGNSPDWQAKAIRRLRDLDISIYNPRRVVAPDEALIADQINWELNSITKCHFIFMHLAADTISPISLYELGLLQGNPMSTKQIVVACDPKYTRAQNVKVTLAHESFKSYNVYFTHSFEGGLLEMKKKLKGSLQYKNY